MTPADPAQPIAPVAPQARDKKAYRHWPSLLLFIGLTASVLASDLWIKSWTFAHVAGRPVVLTHDWTVSPRSLVPEHEPWVLIPHVLDLQLTVNTGAVFGLGQGRQTLFMVVSVVAVGVIFWSFARSQASAHAFHVALALILAGALGNLYDRWRFVCVRDMFWLFPNLRVWPWIFNLADASLMVGMGLLILTLWVHDKRAQSAGSARS